MRKSSEIILLSLLIVLLGLGGAGCTKKAQLARRLEKADHYFSAGDYDNAELEYIGALRLDHASETAFARLGTIYFEQGRLALAYYVLQKARALNTNDLEVHLRLGQFFVAAGKPREAMNEAIFVLAKNPADDAAPLVMADAVATQKDAELARARLENLPVKGAQEAARDVALGLIDFRQGNFKAAQTEWRKARELDPKFGPLYLALGNYYVGEKEFKLADQAFKTSADSAPLRSNRRLRYAQFKLQNNDVEGAKQLLNDLIKKAPDFIPATLALAQIAASEKKYADADQLVKKVLARDESSFDALLLDGRLGLLQNNPARAVASFERMAKIYDRSADVHYQLAVAYNALNDSAKAADNLNLAIKLNPGLSDAIIALAQLKIAHGDYRAAITSLKKLIQQKPKLAQAQLLLANAYRLQGALDDAVKIYQQLEMDYPKSADIPLLRGTVLAQMNRVTEARQAFEKSLQLLPDYPAAIEQLTDLDINARQYAAAIQRVQKVMDQNPKIPETSLLLAKIYVAEADSAKAAAVLGKQVEAHPDFTAGQLMLAHIYNEAGQNQKALETLRPLLARQPDNPSALMQQAVISEQLKDYKTARQAYEKLLLGNPAYTPALNNLACLCLDDNQLDKAHDLARKAFELQPADPATADTLGWVLYHQGNYLDSLPLLQQSAAKLSEPAIQLHLGLAYYMLGNEDAARAPLQTAAQSKETFADKSEAVRCLAVLAVDPRTANAATRAALEKTVADHPNDSIALSRLAGIYKRNGNAEKAAAIYESALKINPQNETALWNLAQIYSAQPKQQAKAFELAKAAYKFAPEDSAIPPLLGRLAYLNGDYKWSVTLLETAARQQPNDRDVVFNLAEAEYSAGQVPDAENRIRDILKSPAGFSRAAEANQFLEMDALWMNPRQAAAAETQVDQLLKNDPDFIPALMAAGVIEEQKNNPAAAKERFEKVLARYPDFVPAKRHLAILYAADPAADDVKAYAVAVKAREAYPDDPEVAKALGIIVYREGDYSRAARLLAESKAQKSSDPQVFYYLGMAQSHLKQNADSKKSLLQALDLKLPDKLAAEARRALAELK